MPREKVYQSDADRLRAWRERRRQEEEEQAAARSQQEEEQLARDSRAFQDLAVVLDCIGEALRLQGWATPEQARSLQAFCRVALRSGQNAPWQPELFHEWRQECRRLEAAPDRWDGSTKDQGEEQPPA